MTRCKRTRNGGTRGACLALAIAVIACGQRAPRARRSGAHAQENTPSARVASADGFTAIDGPELLALIKKSGKKGALVNVWASFCGPCKQELPMLIGIASALRTEGIELILISADEDKARADAAGVLASVKAEKPFYIVRGSIGPFIRALNPAWKGAVPSTFLYDPEASLRYFWPGPVFDFEITPIVEAFLSGQPLEGPARVERGPRPE